MSELPPGTQPLQERTDGLDRMVWFIGECSSNCRNFRLSTHLKVNHFLWIA